MIWLPSAIELGPRFATGILCAPAGYEAPLRGQQERDAL